MISVRELLPAPVLREYVRCYHFTQMELGSGMLRKPLTARPEQMLQFSLARPFSVVPPTSDAAYDAPDVVLVGRQTRRNLDLVAQGTVVTLTLHFQPTGFHRLFHVPMRHLTDLTPDAVDVLGLDVRRLHERVASQATPEDMVEAVEHELLERIDASRPPHPVQLAAETLLHERPGPDVRSLAAAGELSVRQLERAFDEQIGVSPKLFGRIARFAAALQSKSDAPDRSWADVASGAGYFDQMHLIRDCHMFGSDTPSSLMSTWIDCRP